VGVSAFSTRSRVTSVVPQEPSNATPATAASVENTFLMIGFIINLR
jgi:hypothetical protein